MICNLSHSGISLEYNESQIEKAVLWERHCHAQYEIISVLEGDVNIMLEGQSYRIKDNQTILIPPVSYHTVTTNDAHTYKRITALFDISALPDVLQQDFRCLCQDIRILTTPLMQQIKEICVKANSDYYGPLLNSLLMQFFYEALSAAPSAVATDRDVFLHDAISYIDQHIHERISLDDLAAYTSRSKSSFCHLFKEKMKVSPKQYILEKKLALAENFIAEGTPATIAAARVGYDNYSSFYRIYRKYAQNPFGPE